MPSPDFTFLMSCKASAGVTVGISVGAESNLVGIRFRGTPEVSALQL